MINSSPIATKTQEDIVPVSNYVWYKMYEGTGTTVDDTAGNGVQGTVTGTLTNLWDNVGYAQANASDIKCPAGTDAYIAALGDFSTLAVGDRIIVSFDYLFDGAIGATGVIFTLGRGSNGGGWYLQTTTSETLQLDTFGVGGTLEGNAFAGYNIAGTDRHHLTLEIICTVAGTTYDANLYSNGAASAVSSFTDAGMLTGSATAPPQDANDEGLTFFARRTTGVGFDRYLEGSVGNFLMLRHTGGDVTLAQKINYDMYIRQGDLPLALDGK